jgi:hypothetical protein
VIADLERVNGSNRHVAICSHDSSFSNDVPTACLRQALVTRLDIQAQRLPTLIRDWVFFQKKLFRLWSLAHRSHFLSL